MVRLRATINTCKSGAHTGLLLLPAGPGNPAITFGGYFHLRDIWLGLGSAFPLFDERVIRDHFRAAEFGERRSAGADCRWR